MTKYEYEFTYTSCHGDIVVGEIEACVTYTYTPGRLARIRYDENDHPAEAPEIEIVDVQVEDWPGPYWRPATDDEFDLISEYAYSKRFVEMVEETWHDEG